MLAANDEFCWAFNNSLHEINLMEYIEIVEDVVPYVIESALNGIVDSILFRYGVDQGAAAAINDAFSVVHTAVFIPETDSEFIEDQEVVTNMTENYHAYRLRADPVLKKEYSNPLKKQSSHSQNTRSKLLLAKLTWDRFQPEPVPLIREDIHIDELDEKFRTIKMQSVAEQKRQQAKQQERALEQRRLREMHQRAQMNLKKHDYTYDFNCSPLIRQKVNPAKQMVVQEVRVAKVSQVNRSNNSKAAREQIFVKNSQPYQPSSERQLTDEFEEVRQKTVIPYIQLQDGVVFRENNKMLIHHHDLQLTKLRKQDFQNMDPNELIQCFQKHLDQRSQMQNSMPQSSEGQLTSPHVEELTLQNARKSVASQNQRSSNQVDLAVLAQNQVIKLPRIKHQGYLDTLTTPKSNRLSNGRLKSFSVNSPRDQIMILQDLSLLV